MTHPFWNMLQHEQCKEHLPFEKLDVIFTDLGENPANLMPLDEFERALDAGDNEIAGKELTKFVRYIENVLAQKLCAGCEKCENDVQLLLGVLKKCEIKMKDYPAKNDAGDVSDLR